MDLRPFCLSLSFFFALIGEGEDLGDSFSVSTRLILITGWLKFVSREICFEKRVPQADGLGLTVRDRRLWKWRGTGG